MILNVTVARSVILQPISAVWVMVVVLGLNHKRVVHIPVPEKQEQMSLIGSEILPVVKVILIVRVVKSVSIILVKLIVQGMIVVKTFLNLGQIVAIAVKRRVIPING